MGNSKSKRKKRQKGDPHSSHSDGYEDAGSDRNQSRGPVPDRDRPVNGQPTPPQPPLGRHMSDELRRNPLAEKRSDASLERRREPSANTGRAPSEESRREQSTDRRRDPPPERRREPSTNTRRDLFSEWRREPSKDKRRDPSPECKRELLTDRRREPSMDRKKEASPPSRREPSMDRREEPSLQRRSEKSPPFASEPMPPNKDALEQSAGDTYSPRHSDVNPNNNPGEVSTDSDSRNFTAINQAPSRRRSYSPHDSPDTSGASRRVTPQELSARSSPRTSERFDLPSGVPAVINPLTPSTRSSAAGLPPTSRRASASAGSSHPSVDRFQSKTSSSKDPGRRVPVMRETTPSSRQPSVDRFRSKTPTSVGPSRRGLVESSTMRETAPSRRQSIAVGDPRREAESQSQAVMFSGESPPLKAVSFITGGPIVIMTNPQDNARDSQVVCLQHPQQRQPVSCTCPPAVRTTTPAVAVDDCCAIVGEREDCCFHHFHEQSHSRHPQSLDDDSRVCPQCCHAHPGRTVTRSRRASLWMRDKPPGSRAEDIEQELQNLMDTDINSPQPTMPCSVCHCTGPHIYRRHSSWSPPCHRTLPPPPRLPPRSMTPPPPRRYMPPSPPPRPRNPSPPRSRSTPCCCHATPPPPTLCSCQTAQPRFCHAETPRYQQESVCPCQASVTQASCHCQTPVAEALSCFSTEASRCCQAYDSQEGMQWPEPSEDGMEEVYMEVDGSPGYKATVIAADPGIAAAGGTRVVRRRQASIWLRDRRDGSPKSVEDVEEDLQRLLNTGIQTSNTPQGDRRAASVPRRSRKRKGRMATRTPPPRPAIPAPPRHQNTSTSDETPSDDVGTPTCDACNDSSEERLFEEQIRAAVERLIEMKKRLQQKSTRHQCCRPEYTKEQSSGYDSTTPYAMSSPDSTPPTCLPLLSSTPVAQAPDQRQTEVKASELLAEMSRLQQSLAEVLLFKGNVDSLLQSKCSLQNHLDELRDEIKAQRQQVNNSSGLDDRTGSRKNQTADFSSQSFFKDVTSEDSYNPPTRSTDINVDSTPSRQIGSTKGGMSNTRQVGADERNYPDLSFEPVVSDSGSRGNRNIRPGSSLGPTEEGRGIMRDSSFGPKRVLISDAKPTASKDAFTNTVLTRGSRSNSTSTQPRLKGSDSSSADSGTTPRGIGEEGNNSNADINIRESAEKPYSPTPSPRMQKQTSIAEAWAQGLQREASASQTVPNQETPEQPCTPSAVNSQGFDACSTCQRPLAECTCRLGSENNNSDRWPDDEGLPRSPRHGQAHIHQRLANDWHAGASRQPYTLNPREHPVDYDTSPSPGRSQRSRVQPRAYEDHSRHDAGFTSNGRNPLRRRLVFEDDIQRYVNEPAQVKRVKGVLKSESFYEDEVETFPASNREKRRGTMHTRTEYDEEFDTLPSFQSDGAQNHHTQPTTVDIPVDHIPESQPSPQRVGRNPRDVEQVRVVKEWDDSNKVEIPVAHIPEPQPSPKRVCRNPRDAEQVRAVKEWDGSARVDIPVDHSPEPQPSPQRVRRKPRNAERVRAVSYTTKKEWDGSTTSQSYIDEEVLECPASRKIKSREVKFTQREEPRGVVLEPEPEVYDIEPSLVDQPSTSDYEEEPVLEGRDSPPRKRSRVAPPGSTCPRPSPARARISWSPPCLNRVPLRRNSHHYCGYKSEGPQGCVCNSRSAHSFGKDSTRPYCIVCESATTQNLEPGAVMNSRNKEFLASSARQRPCRPWGSHSSTRDTMCRRDQAAAIKSQTTHCREMPTGDSPESEDSLSPHQENRRRSSVRDRRQSGHSGRVIDPFPEDVRDASFEKRSTSSDGNRLSPAPSATLRSPREVIQNVPNEGSWEEFTASGKRLPPPVTPQELMALKNRKKKQARESLCEPDEPSLLAAIRKAQRNGSFMYPKKHNCGIARKSLTPLSQAKPRTKKRKPSTPYSEVSSTHFSRWASPPELIRKERTPNNRRAASVSPVGRTDESGISLSRIRSRSEAPDDSTRRPLQSRIERSYRSLTVSRCSPEEPSSLDEYPDFVNEDPMQELQVVPYPSNQAAPKSPKSSRAETHGRNDAPQMHNAGLPQVEIRIAINSPPLFGNATPQPRRVSPSPSATCVTAANTDSKDRASPMTVEVLDSISGTRQVAKFGPANVISVQPARRSPITVQVLDPDDENMQGVTRNNAQRQQHEEQVQYGPSEDFPFSQFISGGQQHEPGIFVGVMIRRKETNCCHPQNPEEKTAEDGANTCRVVRDACVGTTDRHHDHDIQDLAAAVMGSIPNFDFSQQPFVMTIESETLVTERGRPIEERTCVIGGNYLGHEQVSGHRRSIEIKENLDVAGRTTSESNGNYPNYEPGYHVEMVPSDLDPGEETTQGATVHRYSPPTRDTERRGRPKLCHQNEVPVDHLYEEVLSDDFNADSPPPKTYMVKNKPLGRKTVDVGTETDPCFGIRPCLSPPGTRHRPPQEKKRVKIDSDHLPTNPNGRESTPGAPARDKVCSPKCRSPLQIPTRQADDEALNLKSFLEEQEDGSTSKGVPAAPARDTISCPKCRSPTRQADDEALKLKSFLEEQEDGSKSKGVPAAPARDTISCPKCRSPTRQADDETLKLKSSPEEQEDSYRNKPMSKSLSGDRRYSVPAMKLQECGTSEEKTCPSCRSVSKDAAHSTAKRGRIQFLPADLRNISQTSEEEEEEEEHILNSSAVDEEEEEDRTILSVRPSLLARRLESLSRQATDDGEYDMDSSILEDSDDSPSSEKAEQMPTRPRTHTLPTTSHAKKYEKGSDRHSQQSTERDKHACPNHIHEDTVDFRASGRTQTFANSATAPDLMRQPNQESPDRLKCKSHSISSSLGATKSEKIPRGRAQSLCSSLSPEKSEQIPRLAMQPSVNEHGCSATKGVKQILTRERIQSPTRSRQDADDSECSRCQRRSRSLTTDAYRHREQNTGSKTQKQDSVYSHDPEPLVSYDPDKVHGIETEGTDVEEITIDAEDEVPRKTSSNIVIFTPYPASQFAQPSSATMGVHETRTSPNTTEHNAPRGQSARPRDVALGDGSPQRTQNYSSANFQQQQQQQGPAFSSPWPTQPQQQFASARGSLNLPVGDPWQEQQFSLGQSPSASFPWGQHFPSFSSHYFPGSFNHGRLFPSFASSFSPYGYNQPFMPGSPFHPMGEAVPPHYNDAPSTHTARGQRRRNRSSPGSSSDTSTTQTDQSFSPPPHHSVSFQARTCQHGQTQAGFSNFPPNLTTSANSPPQPANNVLTHNPVSKQIFNPNTTLTVSNHVYFTPPPGDGVFTKSYVNKLQCTKDSGSEAHSRYVTNGVLEGEGGDRGRKKKRNAPPTDRLHARDQGQHHPDSQSPFCSKCEGGGYTCPHSSSPNRKMSFRRMSPQPHEQSNPPEQGEELELAENFSCNNKPFGQQSTANQSQRLQNVPVACEDPRFYDPSPGSPQIDSIQQQSRTDDTSGRIERHNVLPDIVGWVPLSQLSVPNTKQSIPVSQGGVVKQPPSSDSESAGSSQHNDAPYEKRVLRKHTVTISMKPASENKMSNSHRGKEDILTVTQGTQIAQSDIPELPHDQLANKVSEQHREAASSRIVQNEKRENCVLPEPLRQQWAEETNLDSYKHVDEEKQKDACQIPELLRRVPAKVSSTQPSSPAKDRVSTDVAQETEREKGHVPELLRRLVDMEEISLACRTAEENTAVSADNAESTCSATNEKAPTSGATNERAPTISATHERAPISSVTIERAPTSSATIERAPISNATIERAPISNATIERASTSNATIERAPISNATIERAPINNASIERAPTSNATIERAHISNATNERMHTSYATHERAPTSTATNERVPTSYATNERAPTSTATNERVPTSYGTNERVPTSTATNERAPTSTATNDRMPTSYATNERVPTSYATNERAPTSYATNERVPTSYATNERVPTSYATNERVPTSTTTNERVPTSYTTNERVPTSYATNERVPTSYATNERVPTSYATNERVPTSYATNERVPTSYATNERAPTSYITNERAPISNATNERVPTSSATIERAPTSSATIERAPTSSATNENTPTSVAQGPTCCIPELLRRLAASEASQQPTNTATQHLIPNAGTVQSVSVTTSSGVSPGGQSETGYSAEPFHQLSSRNTGDAQWLQFHHMRKTEKLKQKIQNLKEQQRDLIGRVRTDCLNMVDQEVKSKDAQLQEERIAKARLKEAIVSLQKQLTDMERESWKATLSAETAQQDVAREKLKLENQLGNVQTETGMLRAEKEDLAAKLESAQARKSELEAQLNEAKFSSKEKEVLSSQQAIAITNYKNLVDLCHEKYQEQRDTASRLQSQLDDITIKLEERDQESDTLRTQLDEAKTVIIKRRRQLQQFKMMQIELRQQYQQEHDLSELAIKEKKAVEDKLHLETSRYSSLLTQVKTQNKRLVNVRSRVESLDPNRLKQQFEIRYRAKVDLVLRQVGDILDHRSAVVEAAELTQQEMDFRKRAHESNVQMLLQRNQQLTALRKAASSEARLHHDISTAQTLFAEQHTNDFTCVSNTPNFTFPETNLPSRYSAKVQVPTRDTTEHSHLLSHPKAAAGFDKGRVSSSAAQQREPTVGGNIAEKDNLEIRLRALKMKVAVPPARFGYHVAKSESRSYLATIRPYPAPQFTAVPTANPRYIPKAPYQIITPGTPVDLLPQSDQWHVSHIASCQPMASYPEQFPSNTEPYLGPTCFATPPTKPYTVLVASGVYNPTHGASNTNGSGESSSGTSETSREESTTSENVSEVPSRERQVSNAPSPARTPADMPTSENRKKKKARNDKDSRNRRKGSSSGQDSAAKRETVSFNTSQEPEIATGSAPAGHLHRLHSDQNFSSPMMTPEAKRAYLRRRATGGDAYEVSEQHPQGPEMHPAQSDQGLSSAGRVAPEEQSSIPPERRGTYTIPANSAFPQQTVDQDENLAQRSAEEAVSSRKESREGGSTQKESRKGSPGKKSPKHPWTEKSQRSSSVDGDPFKAGPELRKQTTSETSASDRRATFRALSDQTQTSCSFHSGSFEYVSSDLNLAPLQDDFRSSSDLEQDDGNGREEERQYTQRGVSQNYEQRAPLQKPPSMRETGRDSSKGSGRVKPTPVAPVALQGNGASQQDGMLVLQTPKDDSGTQKDLKSTSLLNGKSKSSFKTQSTQVSGSLNSSTSFHLSPWQESFKSYVSSHSGESLVLVSTSKGVGPEVSHEVDLPKNVSRSVYKKTADSQIWSDVSHEVDPLDFPIQDDENELAYQLTVKSSASTQITSMRSTGTTFHGAPNAPGMSSTNGPPKPQGETRGTQSVASTQTGYEVWFSDFQETVAIQTSDMTICTDSDTKQMDRDNKQASTTGSLGGCNISTQAGVVRQLTLKQQACSLVNDSSTIQPSHEAVRNQRHSTGEDDSPNTPFSKYTDTSTRHPTSISDSAVKPTVQQTNKIRRHSTSENDSSTTPSSHNTDINRRYSTGIDGSSPSLQAALHRMRSTSVDDSSTQPSRHPTELHRRHSAGVDISSTQPSSHPTELYRHHSAGVDISSTQPSSHPTELYRHHSAGVDISSTQPSSHPTELYRHHSAGVDISSTQPSSHPTELYRHHSAGVDISSTQPSSHPTELYRHHSAGVDISSTQSSSHPTELYRHHSTNVDISSAQPSGQRSDVFRKHSTGVDDSFTNSPRHRPEMHNMRSTSVDDLAPVSLPQEMKEHPCPAYQPPSEYDSRNTESSPCTPENRELSPTHRRDSHQVHTTTLSGPAYRRVSGSFPDIQSARHQQPTVLPRRPSSQSTQHQDALWSQEPPPLPLSHVGQPEHLPSDWQPVSMHNVEAEELRHPVHLPTTWLSESLHASAPSPREHRGVQYEAPPPLFSEQGSLLLSSSHLEQSQSTSPQDSSEFTLPTGWPGIAPAEVSAEGTQGPVWRTSARSFEVSPVPILVKEQQTSLSPQPPSGGERLSSSVDMSRQQNTVNTRTDLSLQLLSQEIAEIKTKLSLQSLNQTFTGLQVKSSSELLDTKIVGTQTKPSSESIDKKIAGTQTKPSSELPDKSIAGTQTNLSSKSVGQYTNDKQHSGATTSSKSKIMETQTNPSLLDLFRESEQGDSDLILVSLKNEVKMSQFLSKPGTTQAPSVTVVKSACFQTEEQEFSTTATTTSTFTQTMKAGRNKESKRVQARQKRQESRTVPGQAKQSKEQQTKPSTETSKSNQTDSTGDSSVSSTSKPTVPKERNTESPPRAVAVQTSLQKVTSGSSSEREAPSIKSKKRKSLKKTKSALKKKRRQSSAERKKQLETPTTVSAQDLKASLPGQLEGSELKLSFSTTTQVSMRFTSSGISTTSSRLSDSRQSPPSYCLPSGRFPASPSSRPSTLHHQATASSSVKIHQQLSSHAGLWRMLESIEQQVQHISTQASTHLQLLRSHDLRNLEGYAPSPVERGVSMAASAAIQLSQGDYTDPLPSNGAKESVIKPTKEDKKLRFNDERSPMNLTDAQRVSHASATIALGSPFTAQSAVRSATRDPQRTGQDGTFEMSASCKSALSTDGQPVCVTVSSETRLKNTRKSTVEQLPRQAELRLKADAQALVGGQRASDIESVCNVQSTVSPHPFGALRSTNLSSAAYWSSAMFHPAIPSPQLLNRPPTSPSAVPCTQTAANIISRAYSSSVHPATPVPGAAFASVYYTAGHTSSPTTVIAEATNVYNDQQGPPPMFQALSQPPSSPRLDAKHISYAAVDVRSPLDTLQHLHASSTVSSSPRVASVSKPDQPPALTASQAAATIGPLASSEPYGQIQASAQAYTSPQPTVTNTAMPSYDQRGDALYSNQSAPLQVQASSSVIQTIRSTSPEVTAFCQTSQAEAVSSSCVDRYLQSPRSIAGQSPISPCPASPLHTTSHATVIADTHTDPRPQSQPFNVEIASSCNTSMPSNHPDTHIAQASAHGMSSAAIRTNSPSTFTAEALSAYTDSQPQSHSYQGKRSTTAASSIFLPSPVAGTSPPPIHISSQVRVTIPEASSRMGHQRQLPYQTEVSSVVNSVPLSCPDMIVSPVPMQISHATASYDDHYPKAHGYQAKVPSPPVSSMPSSRPVEPGAQDPVHTTSRATVTFASAPYPQCHSNQSSQSAVRPPTPSLCSNAHTSPAAVQATSHASVNAGPVSPCMDYVRLAQIPCQEQKSSPALHHYSTACTDVSEISSASSFPPSHAEDFSYLEHRRETPCRQAENFLSAVQSSPSPPCIESRQRSPTLAPDGYRITSNAAAASSDMQHSPCAYQQVATHVCHNGASVPRVDEHTATSSYQTRKPLVQSCPPQPDAIQVSSRTTCTVNYGTPQQFAHSRSASTPQYKIPASQPCPCRPCHPRDVGAGPEVARQYAHHGGQPSPCTAQASPPYSCLGYSTAARGCDCGLGSSSPYVHPSNIPRPPCTLANSSPSCRSGGPGIVGFAGPGQLCSLSHPPFAAYQPNALGMGSASAATPFEVCESPGSCEIARGFVPSPCPSPVCSLPPCRGSECTSPPCPSAVCSPSPCPSPVLTPSPCSSPLRSPSPSPCVSPACVSPVPFGTWPPPPSFSSRPSKEKSKSQKQESASSRSYVPGSNTAPSFYGTQSKKDTGGIKSSHKFGKSTAELYPMKTSGTSDYITPGPSRDQRTAAVSSPMLRATSRSPPRRQREEITEEGVPSEDGTFSSWIPDFLKAVSPPSRRRWLGANIGVDKDSGSSGRSGTDRRENSQEDPFIM